MIYIKLKFNHRKKTFIIEHNQQFGMINFTLSSILFGPFVSFYLFISYGYLMIYDGM